MIRKLLLLSLLVLIHSVTAVSQKEVRSFIFGHSLINHEFQINPTPSQETSIPHWLHFLSQDAGHAYRVSGQYGFLPQHANLPPFAQWGFDFAEGAWDSDNEPFSAADFNNIIITPGNFIQWQAPDVNYPMETVSPTSATESIFSWCNQQEDGLKFYIYENWPDMGSYLGNGFPPSEDEWISYNEYLNADFHDWYLEYHDLLVENFPNSCIKMIPVGPLISELLSKAPYNEIPIDELYEDDAPHGRATTYFLASLISYMAIYEEKTPTNFEVPAIIHPIVADNYGLIVETFWGDLNAFNYDNGESRAFCDSPVTSVASDIKNNKQLIIMPNPISDFLNVESTYESHIASITNVFGQEMLRKKLIDNESIRLDLSQLANGIYYLIGRNTSGQILYSKILIKKA